VDWTDYKVKPLFENPLEEFKVTGDDKLKSKKWSAAFKEAAFYYDQPTLEEERDMRHSLQRKFDDLFEDNWRPPLQSRTDLLLWTCD